MIYRRMIIDKAGQKVNFHPSAGTDFEPLSVDVPEVESGPEKEDFKRVVTREVRECCGSLACKGEASLVYVSGKESQIFKNFPNYLWLEGANIKCDAIECPLGDPGSGDREPRTPSPDPSVLTAEISET